MQATKQIVERHGAAAVRMEAIAAKVRVSAMAAYRHFKAGRVELLAAVATDAVSDLAAFMREPASGALDPLERAIRLVERYVQFGVENPHLYRLIFSPDFAEPLATFEELLRKRKLEESSAVTFAQLRDRKRNAFDAFVDVLGGASNAPPAELYEHGKALAALAHGLVGVTIDEGLYVRGGESAWRPAVRKAAAIMIAALDVSAARRQ